MVQELLENLANKNLIWKKKEKVIKKKDICLMEKL